MQLKAITLLLSIPFLTPSITIGQYCTSGGPTIGTDTHLSQVFLAGESGSLDYVIGCTGELGVSDQTALSVELGVTAPYSLILNFNSCGGFYSSHSEAWIDFNQNNVFEASESLGNWTGTTPMIQSMDFTVPAEALFGTTRMRVMLREDPTATIDPPLNPCALFDRGSVYDFTVDLIPWVDCSGIIGDDMNTAIEIGGVPYADLKNSSLCFTSKNSTYSSPDVFYKIKGSDLGTTSLKIETCGSAFDTYITILNGLGEVVSYNDDSPSCSPHSELTVTLNEEDSLFIVVEGWGALAGDFQLIVETAADAGTSLNTPSATFDVYPNPTNDVLFLSSQESGVFELYDYQGKMVISKRCPKGTTKLQLATIKSGIYLGVLTTPNGRISKKIAVKT